MSKKRNAEEMGADVKDTREIKKITHDLNKSMAVIFRALCPSQPDASVFRSFRKIFLTPAFEVLRRYGVYAYTTPTKVMCTCSSGFAACEDETPGSFVYFTTQAADRYGLYEEMYLGHYFKNDDDRKFVMLVLNDHIPLVEWNGDSKKIKVGVTSDMKMFSK
tara:strand:- start:143 stop:628 length:486 start_codon:yes stop_codon:yes gene_type:complete